MEHRPAVDISSEYKFPAHPCDLGESSPLCAQLAFSIELKLMGKTLMLGKTEGKKTKGWQSKVSWRH